MTFPRPNLDSKGRLIRGIAATALAGGAGSIWVYSRTAGIALAGAAVFLGFEAARGWCALRACGLKTKF